MPSIPVHTPLGFLGFVLIVLGVFLFLAGLGILSIQKVSVQPGRLTLASGIASAIIGLVLVLVFEQAKPAGGLPASTSEETLTEADTWPVVFYESFDGNQAGWHLARIDDVDKASEQQISNGSLIWTLTSKSPDIWWWTMAPTPAYTDFSYSLHMRRVPGGEGTTTSYGLILRRQGETAYRFLVNDAGQYAVQAYDHAREPRVRDLIGFARTGLLDAGHFNELRVIAVGTQLTFFINGQYVARVEDPAFSKGELGFAVVPDANALGQAIEYDLDEIEVRAPTNPE